MLYSSILYLYLGVTATRVLGQDSTAGSTAVTTVNATELADGETTLASTTSSSTTRRITTITGGQTSLVSNSVQGESSISEVPSLTSTSDADSTLAPSSSASDGPEGTSSNPTTAPTTNAGSSAQQTSAPLPFHIIPVLDSNKCLGIFDTSRRQNTDVALLDCAGGGEVMKWRFQTSAPSQIISLAFGEEKWCLDALGMDDASGPVYINQCDPQVTPGQMWDWTNDGHLVVYNQSRGLDIQDGSVVGGGHIQTWPYVYNNTNQEWFVQTVQTEVPQDTQSQQ